MSLWRKRACCGSIWWPGSVCSRDRPRLRASSRGSSIVSRVIPSFARSRYADGRMLGLEGLLEGGTDADTLSVAEAARLLGVHKNTVRHRIKIGVLPAHKALTVYGEAYVIPREVLGLPVQDPSKP